jgi:glycosyltransferase involved in cell wall biosynthesis
VTGEPGSVAPLISVVMPVRNAEAFLDAAIASIRAQTHQALELIVVDDGSSDRTPEILERHAGEDPRLRCLTQGTIGIVAALNCGIGQAAGAYVARMDADDIARPDRLARQLDVLSRHPAAALVGSSYQVIDRRGRALRTVHLPTAPDEIRARLATGNCIAHPTVLLRRQALDAVGLYRAAFRHCEDYDLWLRLAERYELLGIDEPLLLYREHPGQVTWSGLEQRILSVLAAGLAARARRAGMADPAAGLLLADRAFLQRAGMAEGEIRSQIVARAFASAREAGRAGNRQASREAFRLARRQQPIPWRLALRFRLAAYGILV